MDPILALYALYVVSVVGLYWLYLRACASTVEEASPAPYTPPGKCNARGNFAFWFPDRSGVVYCQRPAGHDPADHSIWSDDGMTMLVWPSRLHRTLLKKAKQGLVTYHVVE